MENIVISGDSIIDLSDELIERYNLNILPMHVTLGDKSFSDGVDIKADDVYEHHAKTGELPKTSAISVGEYIDYFKPIVEQGKKIIHFILSSEMSSSYNNACIAADEFDGNVHVIDSRNLSSGSGLLVLAACDMVKNGDKFEDIVKKSEALTANVDASFVIDSLEYLYKGGRCSALSVLGANLLKLKPCIEVKNGVMGVGKKYRGNFAEVLKQYTKDRIGDNSDIIKDRIFITHAGCDEKTVNNIVDIVKEISGCKEVLVTRAGCTISAHCGRNTLGVLFIRNHPIA